MTPDEPGRAGVALDDFADLDLQPGDTLVLFHSERMIPSVIASTQQAWRTDIHGVHLSIVGYGPKDATHTVIRAPRLLPRPSLPDHALSEPSS